MNYFKEYDISSSLTDSYESYTYSDYSDDMIHNLDNRNKKNKDNENNHNKYIHQTWKTEKVPQHLEVYVKEWKDKNPDYIYKFYTDEDIEIFIKEKYP